jgi:hypothetical protein
MPLFSKNSSNLLLNHGILPYHIPYAFLSSHHHIHPSPRCNLTSPHFSYYLKSRTSFPTIRIRTVAYRPLSTSHALSTRKRIVCASLERSKRYERNKLHSFHHAKTSDSRRLNHLCEFFLSFVCVRLWVRDVGLKMRACFIVLRKVCERVGRTVRLARAERRA